MSPVKFKEANCVYAETQPEYLPLHVFKTADGMVVSCWKMSFLERIRSLVFGKVWVCVLTFNQPLQPQHMAVKSPFEAES